MDYVYSGKIKADHGKNRKRATGEQLTIYIIQKYSVQKRQKIQ